MTVDPWFVRSPERLEYELEALRGDGYEPIIDESAREHGRLILTVQYSVGDYECELTVVFPDAYPYFPIHIFSQSFPDGIHKEPFSGALCFLVKPLTNWESDPGPQSEVGTVARVLKYQLPKILKAHANPGAVPEIEAQEGYQPSGQLPYQLSAIVFVPEWDTESGVRHGKLLFAREPNNDKKLPLRAAVIQARDEEGAVVIEMDANFRKRFQERTFSGRWVELDSAPASADPNQLIAQASKAWPALAKAEFDGGPDVIGLRFPEESTKGQIAWNWVFIVRQKVREKKAVKEIAYLVRADRATLANLQIRVPRLRPLAGRTVFLVGAGSIGSPLAWQLARAGVNLHILDGDYIESGNIPRWLVGFSAVGHMKASLLDVYLNRNYPFIDVAHTLHRLGQPRDDINEDELVRSLMEQADIVVDATAEFCIGHYLSDLAAEFDIPYVWASSTHGAWGGMVGRIWPEIDDECWSCFQSGLADGVYPIPPKEESEEVQAVGCFQSTFPGAGFDLDQVVLMAARLVVGTLCADSPEGYPDFDYSGAVLSLFDDQGRAIPPVWEGFSISRHPDCRKH